MSDQYSEYTENANRLERRTRYTMPAIMLALICLGLAVAGIWPPEGVSQDPYLSWLASPLFVALSLVAALGFVAVSIAGMRADNRLWQIARHQDQRDYRNLLRQLGGEEFARRWEASPRIKNQVAELRIRRGIQQEDLARALDMSTRSMDLLEAGRYAPKLDAALMLSELLDEPLTVLFWVPDNPGAQQ